VWTPWFACVCLAAVDTAASTGPVGGLATAVQWKRSHRLETRWPWERRSGEQPDPHARRIGSALWAEDKFESGVIRVVYKMRHYNDNSGVFIRMPDVPTDEHGEPVHGAFEVQIDNEPEMSREDEYHVTGALYSFTKPLAKPGRPGPEWNTMEITLDGPPALSFSMA
jgi:hypothetical protein